MIECRLAADKLTARKVRWNAEYEGAPFELYVPRWRVPIPIPAVIYVGIEAVGDPADRSVSPSERPPSREPSRVPIVALVDKVREHTKTVRYRPHGQPDDWEIGEPYVPRGVLDAIGSGADWPVTLRITVEWGT